MFNAKYYIYQFTIKRNNSKYKQKRYKGILKRPLSNVMRTTKNHST